jgi:hypothetical protein
MSIDAMKQALEALEELNKASIGVDAVCLPGEVDTAMDALRLAIEQAEKQGAYWEEEARRYAGNADFWREKAKAAVAAEQTAVFQTIEEFMGSEKERHPMFSDGYDYALSHIQQFVKGRQT